MITATEQAWNSATTLYIARKLEQITAEKSTEQPLKVLDMGCGDGNLIEAFLAYGHDLYGYDFPYREESLKARLLPIFGDAYDDHLRMMTDERVIPFADSSFDVIYANQVFEHVRFLDAMVAECARVLKPGGVLVALFPFVTYPIEGHTLIPFVHWLPPGKSRIKYMSALLSLGIGRKHPGMNAAESAVIWENYLNDGCFYRLMNEVVSLSKAYFEDWELDTGEYIRAKLDMLETHPREMIRTTAKLAHQIHRSALDTLITHYFGAVFCMKNPKK